MKIHHLIDSLVIMLTNEEHEFVQSHPREISIGGLYERDRIVAQTLLRKGIYEISKDSKKLELRYGKENNPRPI
jgi:hypothetical protein